MPLPQSIEQVIVSRNWFLGTLCLANVAKVPLQIIEDIERGKAVDIALTDFVRLCFGVCVDPPEIIRRMDEFKERVRTQ